MVYIEQSPFAYRLTDAILYPLIEIFIVPFAYLFHTIRYYLSPPKYPNWPLEHYLAINLRRVRLGYLGWGRVPILDPEADVILPSKSQPDPCEVIKLVIPPLDDSVPRISILAKKPDVVKEKNVTAFMLQSRSGKTGDLLRKAGRGERVVYFIPGGGYVGGHPLRNHTSRAIAQLTNSRVFALNYRKSISDHSAFPGSLLDCLAGYQYLIKDLGFEPKNIMLCGDSAGVNASLALARYLGELEDDGYKGFGQVGSMCLHSPWADMTCSFPSYWANRYTDTLGNLHQVHIPSHTRHYPTQKSNPYFSPALTPITEWQNLAEHHTKIYISNGTAERFYDEILALKDGMEAGGVDVTYREMGGATHSEFVWLERDEIKSLGWSWEILKNDFVEFWKRTA